MIGPLMMRHPWVAFAVVAVMLAALPVMLWQAGLTTYAAWMAVVSVATLGLAWWLIVPRKEVA